MADHKIDPGEAEVFAQNQAMQSSKELLIDEFYARKIAKSYNAKLHGTLYILANLDLKFKVCHYHSCTELLRLKYNYRISDKIINEVYFAVKKSL